MFAFALTSSTYSEAASVKIRCLEFSSAYRKCWRIVDESTNPLSSSEIEIEYGILPLLSNTEFLSSLAFPKTETKLIDIWQLFRITALIMLARIMNLLKSGTIPYPISISEEERG